MEKPMHETLCAVKLFDDILPPYRGTPVADLLAYHNLETPWRTYTRAELIVGMCMDHRKALRIPDNFAYVLRAAGANLRRIDFDLAYAVAIGGVRTLALIGHAQCGMVRLARQREDFVRGLAKHGGWTLDGARDYFDRNAPSLDIADSAKFVCSEARRLRKRFPTLTVAPLMYCTADRAICQIIEGAEPLPAANGGAQ